MAFTHRYDRDAQALYIRLSDQPYAYGRDLDNERRIDYAIDGTPIGVEITCAMAGVNLDDLPQREKILAILHDLNLPVYA